MRLYRGYHSARVLPKSAHCHVKQRCKTEYKHIPITFEPSLSRGRARRGREGVWLCHRLSLKPRRDEKKQTNARFAVATEERLRTSSVNRGLVANGNWNENNRQANFSNDNLENENDNARLRAAVMVMCFALRAAILQACGRFPKEMPAV